MIVRPETPSDYESIRKVNIEAFATHPYSRQTEHLIVEALRTAGALTLSLVAEIDGEVVGHIAFSPATVDGMECGWFVLGPLAVLPRFQRQGIGQQLVKEGLKAMRDLGSQGCVLVGDPAYYNRFGFRNRSELVLEGVPPQFFLCLPMTDQIPHGNVSHHAAFLVSA